MSSRDAQGPSYADVDGYLQELRTARGVGTRFHLSPPFPRIDGRGRTSWTVSLEVWTLRTTRPQTWTGKSAFGAHGAWKTMPAAMLAAARAVEAQWADEEAAAKAQAAF